MSIGDSLYEVNYELNKIILYRVEEIGCDNNIEMASLINSDGFIRKVDSTHYPSSLIGYNNSNFSITLNEAEKRLELFNNRNTPSYKFIVCTISNNKIYISNRCIETTSKNEYQRLVNSINMNNAFLTKNEAELFRRNK